MTNYVGKANGNYPGWAQDQKVIGYQGQPLNGGNGVIALTWAAKLLAALDQETLRQQMLDGTMNYYEPPRVEVFICPSDANVTPKIGTLTYVVNSGMPDPTTNSLNGDVSDVKANGMCHDQHGGRNGPIVKDSQIPDGAGTTLLFAENVQKDTPTTWTGPLQQNPIATANNYEPDMQPNPEQRFGMVWVYDKSKAFAPDPSLFQPINRDTREPSPGNYTLPINEVGSAFARPSSAHPEVVVVAFCGGNTRDLRENIDYKVYQQLMTPNGLKAELPNENPRVFVEQDARANNGGQGFMTPPLNDADY